MRTVRRMIPQERMKASGLIEKMIGTPWNTEIGQLGRSRKDQGVAPKDVVHETEKKGEGGSTGGADHLSTRHRSRVV